MRGLIRRYVPARIVRRVAAAGACLALTGGSLIGLASAASAAMVTVTTTADSGTGSLRAAIANAAPGDTIIFAPGVTGTITLTSGALAIGKNLTITGPGAGTLTISGNGASQIFFINPGASGATAPPTTTPVVSISGLTLADGLARGGAGANSAGCGGGGGGAAGMGGALFDNGGDVTLTGLVVTGNKATGGSGGNAGGNSCGSAAGGGGGVGGPGNGGTAGNGGLLGGTSSGQEGAGGNGGRNSCPAVPAGQGGFGGGGGGAISCSPAASGGFGGGGGGYGGAGGTLGGGDNNHGGGGGGGAGLGGAVFVRSGQLTVTSVSFTGNTATGGGGADGSQSGQGKGGALFVNSGASATGCATFSGNSASSAVGSGTDTNDIYGASTIKACTTTTVTSSANPSIPGQPVTYTATVSPTPDGGTVAFADGGTTIAGCGAVAVNTTTGTATCRVTYTVTGSHSITAVYSGDATYAGSTSAPLVQQVVPDQADLQVKLSGPAQASDGTSVTQKVTVTNHGPATATNITTILDEPAGLTITNADGATAHGPALIWHTASLNPGASVTFTVTAQVGANVHSLAFLVADAQSSTPDPAPFNNSAFAIMTLG